jgi:hypothetical protein
MGSVAKFDFCGEIEKLSPINSMSYMVTNSSKTNFATEQKSTLWPEICPLVSF